MTTLKSPRWGYQIVLGKSRTGYVIIFEKALHNWSAYVPDVPGCVTTGRTLEQTKRNMEEALRIHLPGTREDGLRVQRPRSLAELKGKKLIWTGR
jgi:predicted RNase H-like HicB family nuclease